ncbi:MAG: SURF1 family protein [Paracoccaceae bacterium]
MNGRMAGPALFGIIGCLILVSLGAWQLRRLEWKEALLGAIETRIGAAPVDLSAATAPGTAANYLAVKAEGRLGAAELHVLSSRGGPGFRVIRALTTPEGKVLVDLGFRPERMRAAPPEPAYMKVEGNIQFPNETDGFTPPPDRVNEIWFARDVEAMAEALGTRPLLIVARSATPQVADVTPWPVNTAGIPNNHLNYAITWFLLALAWLGMTGLWLWRIRRRTD